MDYNPDRPGRLSWTESAFTSIDRNRNGVIQRNEWPYDAETFYRVDRNRDNRLSRTEFLGEATWDDDRDDYHGQEEDQHHDDAALLDQFQPNAPFIGSSAA